MFFPFSKNYDTGVVHVCVSKSLQILIVNFFFEHHTVFRCMCFHGCVFFAFVHVSFQHTTHNTPSQQQYTTQIHNAQLTTPSTQRTQPPKRWPERLPNVAKRVPERRPAGESTPNAITERTVGLVAGQARTLKVALEHRIGIKVPSARGGIWGLRLSNPRVPWMPVLRTGQRRQQAHRKVKGVVRGLQSRWPRHWN